MIKGIGVDIVVVSRIGAVYKRHGERFLKRVFTEMELEYINRAPTKFFERMASTFSAKEAVFKTLRLSTPIIFKEIEILRVPSPKVVLYGRTWELAKSNGIGEIFLSIAHDGDFCITYAVAV